MPTEHLKLELATQPLWQLLLEQRAAPCQPSTSQREGCAQLWLPAGALLRSPVWRFCWCSPWCCSTWALCSPAGLRGAPTGQSSLPGLSAAADSFNVANTCSAHHTREPVDHKDCTSLYKKGRVTFWCIHVFTSILGLHLAFLLLLYIHEMKLRLCKLIL